MLQHSILVYQEYLGSATSSRSPSFSGHLQRTGFALVILLITVNQSPLLLQAWLHVPVNNLQPAHQVLLCTLASLYPLDCCQCHARKVCQFTSGPALTKLKSKMRSPQRVSVVELISVDIPYSVFSP